MKYYSRARHSGEWRSRGGRRLLNFDGAVVVAFAVQPVAWPEELAVGAFGVVHGFAVSAAAGLFAVLAGHTEC